MTAATLENKALVAAPVDPDAPASAQMVGVARKYGISPLAQMREMFTLRYGPGKIALPEYYALGLYDPELSREQKRQHVGRISSWELNESMNLPKLTESRVFCNDKVMYTALLAQLGLPTTETQAVVHATRNYGDVPALRSAEDLRHFLLNDAQFPLFGKPAEGRAAIGTAMLTGIEDDQIVLSNGRRIGLETFCKEIWADYHDGYILQTCLVQHERLRGMAGNAVSTLRVVTVRDSDEARVLYALWKVPSPDAMSDNFWQSGSMVAAVDETGRVGSCWYGMGRDRSRIDTHPVSGERFDAVQIPQWDDFQRVASEAHGLFPEFGLVGWDIAITPEGPVIVEFNENPYHALWQVAHRQGIRNADFTPVFEQTAAKSQAILQGKIDMFKTRQRARGRKA